MGRPKDKSMALRFIRSHPIEGSYAERKDLVELARKKLGYAGGTSQAVIAQALDRAASDPKLSQIKSKPHNDHDRRPLTADAVLVRSEYIFHARVIRTMLGDKYGDFVKQYIDTRESTKSGSRWQPPQDEIELFEKYDQGLISLHQVKELLNLQNLKTTMERMGRIYAYKKEQQSRALQQ